MEENTFQTQLEEFFGGTTGGSLGPGVTTSYLESTLSEGFRVGYTAETLGKGVEIYAVPSAGPPESALIDFNSKNNPGTQSFDARIEVSGGENNVFGRGAFNIFANSYGFNGNPINPTPAMNYYGDAFFQPVPLVPSVNHGRAMAVQKILFTGSAGSDAVNPVRTIQLRDPITLTPWFGVFNVYQTATFSGVNQWASSTNWLIMKNASPPTDIVEGQNEREGPSLTILYPEADWNAGGFPQIKLFNKDTSAPGNTFVYMIEGSVFPNNDAF